MNTVAAPPINLPEKSLAVFDNCPRGFEDELVALMDDYARKAVEADRTARGVAESRADSK